MADKTYLPQVIVCGFERGGTTLLSDWLRRSGFFSYFEIGCLLCEEASSFPKLDPYFEQLKKDISKQGYDETKINSSSYESIYKSIFSDITTSNLKTFDKTPKYMSCLRLVKERSSFCKKYIVVTRDPRSLFYSWAKRINSKKGISELIERNLKDFAHRYYVYYFGSIAYIEDKDVFFLKHEDMCLNPIETIKNLSKFLEIEMNTHKILTEKSKYQNVEKGLNFSKPFEALNLLEIDLQEKILESTQKAALFFHSDLFKAKHMIKWTSNFLKAKELIKNFKLDNNSTLAMGKKFDPLFYYLFYQDVLEARLNAVKHFERNGFKEKRFSTYIEKN